MRLTRAPPRARRRESGSTAASIAASSSGSSLPSREASQAVRRERTRRSSRWPSSVRVSPTRRLSSGLGVRVDEAVALEPVDVVRHRGRRDALLGRELADADARRVLDRDEERDLLGRDADGPGLAAQLPADAEQHRPQAVGEGQGVGAGDRAYR